jgi:hypothetical protein
MKTAPSKPAKAQRLDRKSNVALNVLLALTVLWFPLSFIVNPGWYTLGLTVHPEMLLTALMPLVAVKFANALRPKDQPLPKRLYWMEIAFCILWILLWCFMVNGGDTEESIHSIFSMLLGGVFGNTALVALSGPLFGYTAILLSLLAFFMVVYRQQPSESTRRAIWGRRLLIANFTYFLVSFSVEPIFSSFGIFINPYWTWFYDGLAIVGGVLSVLNIGYLLCYFFTTRNISKKFWVFGILAILASAYYIWSGIRYLMLMNGMIAY